MLNNVHTLGLKVNSVSPVNNSINNSTISKVTVEFNSDINATSLINTIRLFEDKNHDFKDCYDPGTAKEIRVNSSYVDKKVNLIINGSLNINTRYVIFIAKGTVENTFGDKMLHDFKSVFYTEEKGTYSPIEILNDYGVVSNVGPVIRWASQEGDAYVVQVANEKTFETLKIDKVIKAKELNNNKTEYDLSEFKFEEGSYYYRVKTLGHTWSEPHQFFIKNRVGTGEVLSQEDVSEDILFLEGSQEELNILEVFPENESVAINEKINIIYIAYEGYVEPERFSFEDSYLEGVLFDEEDYEDISEHGYVGGEWVVVYDKSKDITYVIFTPERL